MIHIPMVSQASTIERDTVAIPLTVNPAMKYRTLS